MFRRREACRAKTDEASATRPAEKTGHFFMKRKEGGLMPVGQDGGEASVTRPAERTGHFIEKKKEGGL